MGVSGRGWWEGHPLLMDSLAIDEKGLGDEKGIDSLSREAELGWGQSISGGPQTLPEPELRPWFEELVRFLGALRSMEHQLSSKMEAQKASCQPPMRKNKKISHPKITQNTHQQSLLGSKGTVHPPMPETKRCTSPRLLHHSARRCFMCINLAKSHSRVVTDELFMDEEMEAQRG